MNFNNLYFDETYLHSKAKKAVQYSREAEYMGNNFKEVINEKQLKEKQESRYKQKHMKS